MTERRYPELTLLVDGEWVSDADRETLPVENPANREILGYLPVATEADLDRALQSSATAFRRWKTVPGLERAAILLRSANLLRERAESIAIAMTLENGKTLAESRGEVLFSADIVDFMAGEASRAYGTVVPSPNGSGTTAVVREPIGPVAAFTPWNYPLTVPVRKIASALAAGCTMILKADEETPASAIAYARALVDAGLPRGVLNLVFGRPAEISSYLIASPIIRKVSFTGFTPVGKHIAKLAAAGAKRTMLELGGHAPVLVFADADVDSIAQMAVGSKLHNTGQSCGSVTRFYLHESIHDRFVERFASGLAAASIGDGMLESSQAGPLANPRRAAAMGPLVADALDSGAQLATGGEGLRVSFDDGYYWRPTLLSRVPQDARVMNEEPFGPIAATATFSTTEEAIALANRLPYGLSAYVFSGSAEISSHVPHQIEAGMVGVNTFGIGDSTTFFGGVKESGYGSEGGPEAVEEYQVRKLIATR